jgi:hypothetical protein
VRVHWGGAETAHYIRIVLGERIEHYGMDKRYPHAIEDAHHESVQEAFFRRAPRDDDGVEDEDDKPEDPIEHLRQAEYFGGGYNDREERKQKEKFPIHYGLLNKVKYRLKKYRIIV